MPQSNASPKMPNVVLSMTTSVRAHDVRRKDSVLKAVSARRTTGVMEWPATNETAGVLGELAAGHRCD